MSDVQITFKAGGPLKLGADATIVAGDSLDLKEDGVIVWLRDEDAAAWRLEQRKRNREVGQVIAHVERRLDPG